MSEPEGKNAWIEVIKDATAKAVEILVPNIIECTDSPGEGVMASLIAAKAIATLYGIPDDQFALYLEQLDNVHVGKVKTEDAAGLACNDPTHNHPKPVVH